MPGIVLNYFMNNKSTIMTHMEEALVCKVYSNF